MTEESKLRERLADYIADEPVLGLSLTDIIARGSRDRRRHRALAVGASVAATVVVGAASTYALEAVPGSDAGDGQLTPAATGRPSHQSETGPQPGHGAHRPAQTLTASAEIPAAIRAVVADYAPSFSTEKAVVASTWQAYDPGPGSSGQPPSLSPNEYDEATSWVAVFQNSDGTNWLTSELDHLPPDKPAGIFDASCAAYAKGDCEQHTLADGRRVVESYSANRLRQASGSFWTFHVIDVRKGDYRVSVTETVTDASSADPHQDYELSSQELLAIASDQRLAFAKPEPLPPLPSWELCLYGSEPPAACP